MSDDNTRYILYRTVATATEAAGYILNAFVWRGGGSELPIPDNTAIAADPSEEYQIGTIYTATTT